jgi:hypothetical protein
MPLADHQRLRRLDKAPRALGIFLDIHVVPSACRATSKTWTRHLLRVSADRIDIRQPAPRGRADKVIAYDAHRMMDRLDV